jgi:hypothetical protein
LKSFETKTGAAGLCKQDMNRFYQKPTVNPAFKLRQVLPPLPVILPVKTKDRPAFPFTGLNKQPAPAIHKPSRDGLISLCKNFAFTSLF